MNQGNFSRRRFLAASGLAASLGFPAIIRPASAAVALRLSSALPTGPNSAHWLWYDRFAASLRTRIGDEVTINYFPDSQLGKESDIIGQVRLGIIDMMISGSSIWATVAQELGLLDLGYLFEDLNAVGRMLDGEAGQRINRIFEDKAGVEVLSWAYSFGWRNVTARVPVTRPQDLNGLKIRVIPVPIFVATLKAMGSVPTPMAGAEIYPALQTGVIDGLEHDAPTVLAFKFHEVAKHISLTQHIFGPQSVVVGKRALARLSPDQRQAVRAAAAEATAYQRAQATGIEAKAMETLKGQGVSIHTCDRQAFRDRVVPVWNEFTATHPSSKPIIAMLSGQT
jgi:tripartite ATP-independent transporter DctP family solute receptor